MRVRIKIEVEFKGLIRSTIRKTRVADYGPRRAEKSEGDVASMSRHGVAVKRFES